MQQNTEEASVSYELEKIINSARTYVKISDIQYKAFADARYAIINAIYVEEKFDVIIENFRELEMELLNTTASYVLFENRQPHDRYFERSTFNRKILNLLNACKLYQEQTDLYISDLSNTTSVSKDDLSNIKSKQYDEHSGYRIIEALCKYVQTRGVPIHSTTENNNKENSDEGYRIKTSISIYISSEEFRKDEKLTASVLSEIEGLGKKINLMPLVREYIDCIWRVHKRVREMIADVEHSAKDLILGAMSDFERTNHDGKLSIRLAVVKKLPNGTYADAVNLFPYFAEYAGHFRKKYNQGRSLNKIVITSDL